MSAFTWYGNVEIGSVRGYMGVQSDSGVIRYFVPIGCVSVRYRHERRPEKVSGSFLVLVAEPHTGLDHDSLVCEGR